MHTLRSPGLLPFLLLATLLAPLLQSVTGGNGAPIRRDAVGDCTACGFGPCMVDHAKERGLAAVDSQPAAKHETDPTATELVLADFEADSYGDWKSTGEAFGPGPARGTLAGQMPVSGFEGKGLVNSFWNGDGTTGTLTSPEFKIERHYLNFLIGGGHHPGETCVNLLVGGKVVRTATGNNDKPGGSERLDWVTWDVAELNGQTAVVEIIDKHTGGWGHINVDQFVQSEKRRQAEPARRVVVIDKPYLLFPVKTGAAPRRMKLVIDDKTVREFEIELADGTPDFQAFSDVKPFKGQTLSIEIDALPADSKALAAIAQSGTIDEDTTLYAETLRPQFHFTSRRGWLNDPNGLVYFQGEYHLFYQHNPFGWNWGNMHWGHAVSRDLVHWKELPIAIYPRAFGDWAFSGSAVVDTRNTAGFQDGPSAALVAAYTSTGRGECLAYSIDGGRTWVDYDQNPVVKHAGRDPKLLWHEPTQRWVMAVYDEHAGKQWIAFYISPDLKTWEFASRIEGFFECPDLFELTANPTGTAVKKWVLYAADGQYVLGDFDGRTFTPDSNDKHKLWYGNFYAAQTYSDAPDGRRIQIGWGNGITFPGMPFNQQMTVPCELTLRKTVEGLRMFAEPVPELKTLANKKAFLTVPVTAESPISHDVTGELLDIEIELQPGTATIAQISVRGIPVFYNFEKRELSCRNVTAPLDPLHGVVALRILADRGSLEIFGNKGRVALSIAVIPDAKSQSIEVTTPKGALAVKAMRVSELDSAWKE